uniref:AI-2E family transporter n=1 Tax=Staphylococcus aureus TaxID=1280 RepID=UPI000AE1AD64
GILLFIGYSLIGIKYSLVSATLAALTSLVPYLGPTIAISPAIVIAAITSPWMRLKLAVVWTSVEFVEGHFISPTIMGKSLKNHPITIIFILLCAGKLLGIVGVILGIPGYAILKVLVT